jgi:hypothetical protein
MVHAKNRLKMLGGCCRPYGRFAYHGYRRLRRVPELLRLDPDLVELSRRRVGTRVPDLSAKGPPSCRHHRRQGLRSWSASFVLSPGRQGEQHGRSMKTVQQIHITSTGQDFRKPMGRFNSPYG